MGKLIATGRRTSPESVLFLRHPRCIRPGCGMKMFEGMEDLGLCAEHLLETYQAVARKMKRAVVPGLPLGLGAEVFDPTPAPVVAAGVYYVDFGEYLKIGYTSNVEKRMATFRTSHPSPQLLAMEPGPQSLERTRHREFAEHRIEREMFRHCQPILDHIRSIGGRVA